MKKTSLFVAAALCGSVCASLGPAPASAQGDSFDIGSPEQASYYSAMITRSQIIHNTGGALDPLSARDRYVKRGGGKGRAQTSLSDSIKRTVRPSKTVRASSASAGALTFRPSASVRQRVLANYVAEIRKTNPNGAAKMQKAFASQDIFALLGRVMARYGLKTNNVADAMTLYVLTGWQGARGANGDLPVAQVRAVRGQMARALASTPSVARATSAQKQELSDSLLVQALLFDGFVVAAKQQPSAMPQTKAIIAQSVRATFGLDLNALRLTNQGLRA